MPLGDDGEAIARHDTGRALDIDLHRAAQREEDLGEGVTVPAASSIASDLKVERHGGSLSLQEDRCASAPLGCRGRAPHPVEVAPQPLDIAPMHARRLAVVALAKPGGDAADEHAEDERRENDDEERHVNRVGRIGERVEGEVTFPRLPTAKATARSASGTRMITLAKPRMRRARFLIRTHDGRV